MRLRSGDEGLYHLAMIVARRSDKILDFTSLFLWTTWKKNNRKQVVVLSTLQVDTPRGGPNQDCIISRALQQSSLPLSPQPVDTYTQSSLPVLPTYRSSMTYTYCPSACVSSLTHCCQPYSSRLFLSLHSHVGTLTCQRVPCLSYLVWYSFKISRNLMMI